jgi:hypothetical protein
MSFFITINFLRKKILEISCGKIHNKNPREDTCTNFLMFFFTKSISHIIISYFFNQLFFPLHHYQYASKVSSNCNYRIP